MSATSAPEPLAPGEPEERVPRARPDPRPSTGTAIREHLIAALRADLIGPFAPSSDDTSTEILPQTPTRWYLTGFLAPEVARDLQDDPTTEEEPGAGDDGTRRDAGEAEPGPKIKQRWPASLGLSVLLPAGSDADEVEVTVRYARYRPIQVPVANDRQPDDDDRVRAAWQREPVPAQHLRIRLDPAVIARSLPLPESADVHITGKLGTAAGRGLPSGTRALSLFLVNRQPSSNPRQPDPQCLFQVSLELAFGAGFVARPNRQGEGSSEADDNVNDLQFRNRCEYGVGHGIAVEVAAVDSERVIRLRTTWLPRANVPHVKTRAEGGVETRMEELARHDSPDAVRQALGLIVARYSEWIAAQRVRHDGVDSAERRETAEALLDDASIACERIGRGIELIASDPVVRRAFQLANRAMAMAARQRSPNEYSNREPGWRLFQLAFLLLNVPGTTHAGDAFRDVVELIFFPTGGGKTEAYLGVIAFTLALRRLRGRERPDGGLGVAVLLRYTLRLLTLDQLSRAASLVCALERLRQVHPEELGDVRFSIGVWVGGSTTPNTLKDASEAIGHWRQDERGEAPFPLTQCPWCGSRKLGAGLPAFDFRRYPNATATERIVVSCRDPDCAFNEGKDPSGLPVVYVDEQVYHELPSFLVATVDKFAMMPWRGEVGMLFGRADARQGERFFGPLAPAPAGAIRLPKGLRPPELIVQDELHLISGPLGTLVGLYETAVEQLCALPSAEGRVRPKVLAATATVRRSEHQIRALFARERRLFPPPGIDDSETFFAEVDRESPERLYLGVAAPGRAMKAVLLRTYVALMAASNRCYDPAAHPEQAADAYMTLAGYFNSLRELGGMRRLCEDDVRTRVSRAEERCPLDWQGPHPWFRDRSRLGEPLELTSRESTEKVKRSKARLARPHAYTDGGVDMLLASNMISVGIDIDRLGLMVVAGQPKTTSEYIQASSRVGRHRDYPGLVVTCFNVMRPRDRSHYERFGAYHEAFYRHVEASSVTPFSGPALDRGLAGTLVAMVRHSEPRMTPPEGAMRLGAHRAVAEDAVLALAERAGQQPSAGADDVAESVRRRARKLLDHWEAVIEEAKDGTVRRTYSEYDRTPNPFLHTTLEQPSLAEASPESHFVAPTSLRDVEPSSPLWFLSNKKKDDHGALPNPRTPRGRNPKKSNRHDLRRRRDG